MKQQISSVTNTAPEDAAAFAIAWVSIERVIPYEKNPRRNDGAAVAKVAASLREFGWRQPIVVDAKGVIIAGHTRLKAALSLGMTEVPVHVATNLSNAQAKAYRIADNRTGEESEWDVPVLAEELAALRLAEDLDLDALAKFTAFDLSEIERILGADPTTELGESFADNALGIFVTCISETDQHALFDRLTTEGRSCKLIT